MLRHTMNTAEWIPVCKLDDIPVLGARRVQRPHGTPVAVFRNADHQVFALLDRCPHKGGPLSQGIVYGNNVACPLHNWQIRLTDGCAHAPDEGCSTRFSVQLQGDQVLLNSEEINTLALD
jgi:nitrite reductase (NADH) small subunit